MALRTSTRTRLRCLNMPCGRRIGSTTPTFPTALPSLTPGVHLRFAIRAGGEGFSARHRGPLWCVFWNRSAQTGTTLPMATARCRLSVSWPFSHLRAVANPPEVPDVSHRRHKVQEHEVQGLKCFKAIAPRRLEWVSTMLWFWPNTRTSRPPTNSALLGRVRMLWIGLTRPPVSGALRFSGTGS